jgi:hypothetical protein
LREKATEADAGCGAIESGIAHIGGESLKECIAELRALKSQAHTGGPKGRLACARGWRDGRAQNQ